ncbi:hypothetical protein BKA70DRAFT_1569124 [Coprinopsis sp. MPI-PUGE-AT-0042]|nr:hypothetical protein BKA70DRAFT_1569124 [Coprinopsis sp. MPI-PUGE-AT-0042]
MQGNPLSYRPISLWTGFKFSASPNQCLRFVVYHLTLVLILDIWLLFRNIALRTLSAKFPSYNSSTSLVELELADTAIPSLTSSYTLLDWSILPEDIGVVRTSAPPRWVQRESGGLVLLQERWWCHAMALEVKTEGEVAGWRETMNGQGMEDRRSEISSEGSKAVTYHGSGQLPSLPDTRNERTGLI